MLDQDSKLIMYVPNIQVDTRRFQLQTIIWIVLLLVVLLSWLLVYPYYCWSFSHTFSFYSFNKYDWPFQLIIILKMYLK